MKTSMFFLNGQEYNPNKIELITALRIEILKRGQMFESMLDLPRQNIQLATNTIERTLWEGKQIF